jgi:hypothetical protein
VSASGPAEGISRPGDLYAVEADLEAEIVMAESSRPPGPVTAVDSTLSTNPAELDQYKARLHTLLDATHVAEGPAHRGRESASQAGVVTPTGRVRSYQ